MVCHTFSTESIRGLVQKNKSIKNRCIEVVLIQLLKTKKDDPVLNIRQFFVIPQEDEQSL